MESLGASRDEARRARLDSTPGQTPVGAPEPSSPHVLSSATLNIPAAITEEVRAILEAKDKALALVDRYYSHSDKITQPMLVARFNLAANRGELIFDAICEELDKKDVPYVVDQNHYPMVDSDNHRVTLRIAHTEEDLSPSISNWVKSAYTNLFSPDLRLDPGDKKRDLGLAVEQWSGVIMSTALSAFAVGVTAYTIATFTPSEWMMSVLAVGMSAMVTNVFGGKALTASHTALAERIRLRVTATTPPVDSRAERGD